MSDDSMRRAGASGDHDSTDQPMAKARSVVYKGEDADLADGRALARDAGDDAWAPAHDEAQRGGSSRVDFRGGHNEAADAGEHTPDAAQAETAARVETTAAARDTDATAAHSRPEPVAPMSEGRASLASVIMGGADETPEAAESARATTAYERARLSDPELVREGGAVEAPDDELDLADRPLRRGQELRRTVPFDETAEPARRETSSFDDPSDPDSAPRRRVHLEDDEVDGAPTQAMSRDELLSAEADAAAGAREPAHAAAGEPTAAYDRAADHRAGAHDDASLAETRQLPATGPAQSDEELVETRRLDTATPVDDSETVAMPVAAAQPAADQPADGATRVAEPVARRDPADQPVLVDSFLEPRQRGNRGFGFLMTLLATIVFAAGWIGISAVYAALTNHFTFEEFFRTQLVGAEIYVPVIVFFVFFWLLSVLTNRGGWWSYVIFGLIIGLLVFASVPIATQVQQMINGGAMHRVDFATLYTSDLAYLVPAVLGGVWARELVSWFGAAIAARGRVVRRRNDEAWDDYERQVDAYNANVR